MSVNPEPNVVNLEQPPEDVLDQRREIVEEPTVVAEDDLPLEADPGDAVEQRLPVETEEDYAG